MLNCFFSRTAYHTEMKVMVNCFFSLTAYLTRITVDAQLFLQLHRVSHSAHSLSQAKQLVLNFIGCYALPSINIDPPVCHSLNHSHREHYIAEFGSGLYKHSSCLKKEATCVYEKLVPVDENARPVMLGNSVI
jgi:hypothetical protein